LRRPVAGAPLDAVGDASGLLALRRRVEAATLQPARCAGPATTTAQAGVSARTRTHRRRSSVSTFRWIMLKTFLIPFISLTLVASASAQTPGSPSSAAPATLRLTADDAVKTALEHNVDLSADRLDPQISDTRVAAAAGAFKPTFITSVNRNNQ